VQRLRSKLTYSNVMVTVLALVVLGGGTAYAANELGKESVGSKQLAKEAVTPSKLSKSSRKALAGARGATGATGATGPQGIPGIQGTPGQPGAAGSARAYATISATAVVTDSKNITQADVVHAGGSLLCISGLSFEPKNAVASSIFGESQNLITSVSLDNFGACPTGTQVAIATYIPGGGPEAGAVSVLIT
jgi:hypothetical protein